MTPGLYTTIARDAYHADPCPAPSLSQSIAHTVVMQSPAHGWHEHPRGGGAQSARTKATGNGTLIDSLLLGGDTEIVEVQADDWRTKAAREARDEAHAAGKLAVLAAELEGARRVADILRAKLSAEGVVLDGANQVTAIWTERAQSGDDVWCRARLDHWRESAGIIYDLKTTKSAHPRDVARSMITYGYDIQGAVYPRAVEKLRPDLAGRVQMRFLFVECEPPYQVLVVRPSGTMAALGLQKWERAVNEWALGLAAGRWAGYASGEVTIEPPPWAMAEMEAIALQGGSQGTPF